MADYDTNTETYLSRKERDVLNSDTTVLETHTLLETIGDIRGKTAIDLCCGGGRLARHLVQQGAAAVTGVDISAEMLNHAVSAREQMAESMRERLAFVKADIANTSLMLESVDLVTGLYVLHYAPSLHALKNMAQFISRHLKPDGRCVLVTMNPDMDWIPNKITKTCTGIIFEPGNGPKGTMRLGDDFSCNIWHWTREEHEAALRAAGLTAFTWSTRDVPDDRPDLKARYAAEIEKPHNVVLTARKA